MIIDITKEEAKILKKTINFGLVWIELEEEKTEEQRHIICVLNNIRNYLEEQTK